MPAPILQGKRRPPGIPGGRSSNRGFFAWRQQRAAIASAMPVVVVVPPMS